MSATGSGERGCGAGDDGGRGGAGAGGGGETAGGTSAPEGAEPVATAGDYAYFRAIEDRFIGLRGSPLLLSPSDFRIAQRWHRRGVPLALIERILPEVFARRAERAGARGKVYGLRYCAPAIESAWEEIQELQAPGERETAAPALDVPARLDALAAALPARLPGRDELAAAMRALAGPPEAVEAALARLDDETLDAAERRQRAAGRAELERQAAASLAAVAGRLPAAEIDAAKGRLLRRLLRKRIGLPVLSLFAPEAEGGEGPHGDR
jgi:hypothetical protein